MRASSHLVFGLCKIYKRKSTYLFKDCNETVSKVKMAFRPGTGGSADNNQSRTDAKAAANQVNDAGLGNFEGRDDDDDDDDDDDEQYQRMDDDDYDQFNLGESDDDVHPHHPSPRLYHS